MTKEIKVFEFVVSNYNGDDVMSLNNEYDKCITANKKRPYSSMCEIEEVINNYLNESSLTLEDIKVTEYTLLRHNNGGCDTVKLVYTLIMKKSK